MVEGIFLHLWAPRSLEATAFRIPSPDLFLHESCRSSNKVASAELEELRHRH